MSLHFGNRKGNAMVEFGLIAPLLFPMMLAAFDFGMYTYAFISVQNAVRVAALRNSGGPDSAADQASACAMVIEELRGLPNIGPSFQSTCGASPLVVTSVLCSSTTPCAGSTKSADGSLTRIGLRPVHDAFCIFVTRCRTERNFASLSDEREEHTMKTRFSSRRGNAALEMALVAMPLMLFVVSTMELGRGLWCYHTLGTAIKSGARYAVVHGASCISASSDCQATVGDIAGVIGQSAVGIDTTKLQLTLTSGGQAYNCDSASGCLWDSTAWPTSPYNAPGLQLTINGTYAFQSALGFLWPGWMPGALSFSAKSTETIEF